MNYSIRFSETLKTDFSFSFKNPSYFQIFSIHQVANSAISISVLTSSRYGIMALTTAADFVKKEKPKIRYKTFLLSCAAFSFVICAGGLIASIVDPNKLTHVFFPLGLLGVYLSSAAAKKV